MVNQFPPRIFCFINLSLKHRPIDGQTTFTTNHTSSEKPPGCAISIPFPRITEIFGQDAAFLLPSHADICTDITELSSQSATSPVLFCANPIKLSSQNAGSLVPSFSNATFLPSFSKLNRPKLHSQNAAFPIPSFSNTTFLPSFATLNATNVSSQEDASPVPFFAKTTFLPASATFDATKVSSQDKVYSVPFHATPSSNQIELQESVGENGAESRLSPESWIPEWIKSFSQLSVENKEECAFSDKPNVTRACSKPETDSEHPDGMNGASGACVPEQARSFYLHTVEKKEECSTFNQSFPYVSGTYGDSTHPCVPQWLQSFSMHVVKRQDDCTSTEWPFLETDTAQSGRMDGSHLPVPEMVQSFSPQSIENTQGCTSVDLSCTLLSGSCADNAEVTTPCSNPLTEQFQSIQGDTFDFDKIMQEDLVDTDFFYGMDRIFKELLTDQELKESLHFIFSPVNNVTSPTNSSPITSPVNSSPIANLPPAECLHLGTKDFIFLSSSLRWFSSYNPLYLDVDQIKNAVNELNPSGNSFKSLKKRAHHCALIACIGLGALIDDFYSDSYLLDFTTILMGSHLLQTKQNINNYESLFAYHVMALFFFVTNNEDVFRQIMCKVQSLGPPKCTGHRKKRRTHAQLFVMSSTAEPMGYGLFKPVLWRQITLHTHSINPECFPNICQKGFEYQKQGPKLDWEDDLFSVLLESSVPSYMKYISDACIDWALQDVMINADSTLCKKIEILQEVLQFHRDITRHYNFSFEDLPPEVKTSVELLQMFVLLMSEEFSEAKLLVKKTVAAFLESPLLLQHFITTVSECSRFRLHQLHCLAISLSVLDMYVEYDKLQERVRKIGEQTKTCSILPHYLPVSMHGICSSAICNYTWSQLANIKLASDSSTNDQPDLTLNLKLPSHCIPGQDLV